MGWSAATEAVQTMEAWTNACVRATHVQNAFPFDGQEFMWEHGREQTDGAIVGSVFRLPSGTRCGTFRIEPDGSVTRWPKVLRVFIEGSKP